MAAKSGFDPIVWFLPVTPEKVVKIALKEFQCDGSETEALLNAKEERIGFNSDWTNSTFGFYKGGKKERKKY